MGTPSRPRKCQIEARSRTASSKQVATPCTSRKTSLPRCQSQAFADHLFRPVLGLPERCDGCGLRLMFIRWHHVAQTTQQEDVSRRDAKAQRRREVHLEHRATLFLAKRQGSAAVVSESPRSWERPLAAICAGETCACASRPEAAPTGPLSELRHGANRPLSSFASLRLCASYSFSEKYFGN